LCTEEEEEEMSSSSLDVVDNTCKQCSKCAPLGERFEWCGGCHYFQYCSRKCQKKHWKSEHKHMCGVMPMLLVKNTKVTMKPTMDEREEEEEEEGEEGG